MQRRDIVIASSILVCALTAAGCSHKGSSAAPEQQPAQAHVDLAAVRSLIKAKNDQFTRAHVAGDVATIDAFFARDAKSFPPGADAVIGITGIHELTVEYIKGGIKEFSEETTDLYGDENLLIDEGIYAVTYGADKVTERGKYLNVWKREDGSWKIQANIWNTSTSPATAK